MSKKKNNNRSCLVLKQGTTGNMNRARFNQRDDVCAVLGQRRGEEEQKRNLPKWRYIPLQSTGTKASIYVNVYVLFPTANYQFCMTSLLILFLYSTAKAKWRFSRTNWMRCMPNVGLPWNGRWMVNCPLGMFYWRKLMASYSDPFIENRHSGAYTPSGIRSARLHTKRASLSH